MTQRRLKLNQLLSENTSTFLFGPRGVGKTHLIEDFLRSQEHTYYVDLLDLELRRRYLAAPGLLASEIDARLVDGRVLTVAIDEVQAFPDLLNEVHRLIESKKGQIRFILTVSSARKLKKQSANMLAGRAWTLHLHPLCSSELDLNLERALQYGTLPAVYLGDDTERRLRSYVDTYLKEEILQEALIRKLESFSRFLEIAGQYNAEPVNYSKIARACSINPSTAQDYYSILVDTMIAFRVNAWSYSVSRQIAQAPRYYLFDCGVLNTITGELQTELRAQSFRFGKLFESFIVQELHRLNDYNETHYRFFHWRTSTGLEVDLILSRGPRDRALAIEIKSDTSPSGADLRGLAAFAIENPSAQKICLCRTPARYSVGDISVFPWREGLEWVFQQGSVT